MAYKRQTPEEKEKRKQELLKKCEDIINNFAYNPDEIVEYLKFNAKFYQYSKNNNILIYAQNDAAQFCASFAKFKEMGYSVKKGEHGMKILVPYITKLFYDSESEEWKKVSQATKEEKEKIKDGKYPVKEHVSFGVGTIFDIAQTDCPAEDYPKYFGFGNQSKTHKELYNAVVSYSEQRGVPVEIKDLKNVFLAGYYSVNNNSITLSDKLNDDRRLSVMTHELAHALLHNSVDIKDEKSIPQIEFEADALSLLLREHLGISDIEASRQAHLQSNYKKYLNWAEENKDKQHCPDISEILDNINNTYSDIVADFDKAIEHYFELHPTKRAEFKLKIDDFLNGKIHPYEQIFICKTTKAMLACGAEDLDVIINQSTLRKIMSNDETKYKHAHNLDVDTIKSIPDELNSPIMIFRGSEPSSIVLISNLTDKHSQNIIIACKLNSTRSLYEVNEITSMYPKNNIANYISNQLNKHNLIGCNKKRANRLLKSLGIQSSEVEASIDYTNIISDIAENVNNQISENSSENYYNITIDEVNNRLSNEVIANLQMFVDSDMQIYGEIQESTLNAIDMQGYKYINGEIKKNIDLDFGDENSLNIDTIKSALSEMSSQEVLELLDDNQIHMFVEYIELYHDNSEPLDEKLKSLYLDISEYLEYNEYEMNMTQNNYPNPAEDLLLKNSLIHQINLKNQLPADILKDKSEIQDYNFRFQVNDIRTLEETLWSIHENDMQIVSINGSEKGGFKIYQLDRQYQLQPYNQIVYPSESEAIKQVLYDDNIAKLIPYDSMRIASYSKELSPMTDSENLKYPFIRIFWSEAQALKSTDFMSLPEAEGKFTEVNNQAGNDNVRTSFSLHLDNKNIYNFNYIHSKYGSSIPEYIKIHLQELESQETLDESLANLKDYIDRELPEAEQLSFEDNLAFEF